MGRSNGALGLFLGVLMLTVSPTALASDPDLTTDFDVPGIPNVLNFTFAGFSKPTVNPPNKATPALAGPAQVPGLNGLGLMAVLFSFGTTSQIDPHTHPRATEVFFLLEGTVTVGFVDTNNTLFETTLQAGDLFVFPKGLLHFQRNNDAKKTALGYSVLSSENPGTLVIAHALFTASGEGLPDNVLEAALLTSESTVDSIKGSLEAKSH